MSTERQALATHTIGSIVRRTAEYFAQKGIETARLDAEVLLAHTLNLSRIQLFTRLDQPLLDAEVDRYRELVRQRAARRPVQHIVGTAEFWSLPLTIAPGVFCPRPDTETLVAAVLDLAPDKSHSWNLLELCAGTACISLALAKERPRAHIDTVELVAATAICARANIDRLNMADRVTLYEGDLYAPLAVDARYDAIISNPPYIRHDEIDSLMPEVSQHESRHALDGGTDGLDFYRRIFAGAGPYLAHGGFLAVEIGDDQAHDVTHIAHAAGFTATRLRHDLAKRPRVVIAARDESRLGARPAGDITFEPEAIADDADRAAADESEAVNPEAL